MNSEPIIRADLHVHSIHSERPSEWILKTLGTRESYTQPEHIYRQAREHGMDLVTITDHNTIDGVLELRTRYGRDILMGVEATTYFPEDGCKIHVLIYGFSEGQFAEINRARASIYDLTTCGAKAWPTPWPTPPTPSMGSSPSSIWKS
jgi:predicted metal-dependent phosphoesterase TrpH